MNKCRVCDKELFEKPLIVFKDMPKSAQFLPDKTELKSEKAIDLTICQCSGCGLVQITNYPVHYYKEVIRAVGISKEMEIFRLNQFKEFIDKYALHNKKIIEIGCGFGEYLSLMTKCDINTYGIEFSEKAVKSCKEKDLNVTKHFIDSSKYILPDAPYDAFFIMSFLEHIPDINSLLRGIYNNLSDEGTGIVEVPNFDMILQKNLFSEFITDHIFYFTKETLENTLKINGFEIVECKSIWHDYILSAIVKKRKILDVTHFYNCQNNIKQELNKYIDKFGIKNVAVWGAGHQSLAIISLSGLKNKIKYVVDSAEFKQNKFTPATHIPILAPGKLNTDKPLAVIVIAGSYSDEVAKIIRNNYDKNIEIAILRDFGLEIIGKMNL